jgi:hypothetical protein
MSTLTYTHRDMAPAGQAEAAPRRGFWSRVFDAISRAQERRAEREIARFLANHGGLLTDDMERELMQRLTGQGKRTL